MGYSKYDSVKVFVGAAVGIGDIRLKEAHAAFDKDGVGDPYKEGHAQGFKYAAELILKYIEDIGGEVADDDGKGDK
jgi:hypothetical protein